MGVEAENGVSRVNTISTMCGILRYVRADIAEAMSKSVRTFRKHSYEVVSPQIKLPDIIGQLWFFLKLFNVFITQRFSSKLKKVRRSLTK